MEGLLLAKGETGGKNTARFPGRNITIGSQAVDGKIGILFVLGEERMIDFEGVNVSSIDLQHVKKDDPWIIRKVWKG